MLYTVLVMYVCATCVAEFAQPKRVHRTHTHRHAHHIYARAHSTHNINSEHLVTTTTTLLTQTTFSLNVAARVHLLCAHIYSYVYTQIMRYDICCTSYDCARESYASICQSRTKRAHSNKITTLSASIHYKNTYVASRRTVTAAMYSHRPNQCHTPDAAHTATTATAYVSHSMGQSMMCPTHATDTKQMHTANAVAPQPITVRRDRPSCTEARAPGDDAVGFSV